MPAMRDAFAPAAPPYTTPVGWIRGEPIEVHTYHPTVILTRKKANPFDDAPGIDKSIELMGPVAANAWLRWWFEATPHDALVLDT